MEFSAAKPQSDSCCEVALFHSVLGVRPAVHAFAESLRGLGHTVHVIDLYDGRTFGTYEEGLAFVDAMGGIGTLMERTVSSVSQLPDALVYAGFSNGGGSAQLLAMTRPGARGAVLMHAALPPEALGLEAWPAGVPCQVHYATRDPFREEAGVRALEAAVGDAGAPFTLCEYNLDAHLFADAGLPDEYDAAAAKTMLEQVHAFLSGL